MNKPTVHRLDALFFSPLLTFQLPGATELNRTLSAEIAAMRAQSAGIQRSNKNGWRSERDFFARNRTRLSRARRGDTRLCPTGNSEDRTVLRFQVR